MARITIEDCAKIVPNRFELVVLVLQRTLAIYSGSKPLVDRDDKEIVLAIREIASGKADIDRLREDIINKYRRDVSVVQEAGSSKNIPSFFSESDFGKDFGKMEDGPIKANEDIGLDMMMFADQDVEVED